MARSFGHGLLVVGWGIVPMIALSADPAPAAAATDAGQIWVFCHGASSADPGRIVYSPVFEIAPDERLVKRRKSATDGLQYLADRDGLAAMFQRDIYGPSAEGMYFYSCGGAEDRSLVETVKAKGRAKYERDGFRVRQADWTPRELATPSAAAAGSAASPAIAPARAVSKERADAEFARKQAEHQAAVERYEAQLKAVAEEKARQAAKLAADVKEAAAAIAQHNAELARSKAEQEEYERKLREQQLNSQASN